MFRPRHTIPVHYRARHSFFYYVLSFLIVAVILTGVIDVVELIGAIL